MPIVDVVPISRPSDLVHETLHPGAVDCVPGVAVDFEVRADDDAISNGEDVRNVVDVDAGVGEDGHVLDRLADFAQVGLVGRLAGDRTRDQDRVRKRGEHSATRSQLDWPLVERMGELGIDVEEQLQVATPEIAPEPHCARAVRLPDAHVGGEYAGEDLAHEAGAGRSRDRDARLRVPEIVDAERHFQCGLHRRYHGRHRRHAFRSGFEQVWAVVLVAEHDGVDAARLQLLHIGEHAVDELRHAA
jgi:hypothetical protein